jgi:hypothetical protein
VTQFLSAFILMGVIAAVYMLGVLMFGGRINYWQALAIAVHAALPAIIIDRVLSLVLLYVKDPDDVHPILGQSGLVMDNLGALVSPSSSPVLFAAASAFGILTFYRVWLSATGLRHGGERVSSTAAWSIVIALWVVGLVLAMLSSLFFGSFIS